MTKKCQYNIAVFFTILFMAIISAPSVIMSIDDSIDTTYIFGENEEEEKECFKLLFEITPQVSGNYFVDIINTNNDCYTFKKYSKPHLNLISPPPENT